MTKDEAKKLKITDRQLAVLKRLSERGAYAGFVHCRESHWYLSVTMKSVTREVRGLRHRGLIDVQKEDWNRVRAKINRKGRAALKALWKD